MRQFSRTDAVEIRLRCFPHVEMALAEISDHIV
jgi:hypothetical protein